MEEIKENELDSDTLGETLFMLGLIKPEVLRLQKFLRSPEFKELEKKFRKKYCTQK